MPAPGTIDFSFRVDEDYAAVCVEGVSILSSPTNPASGLLDRPPIPNVMLGSGIQSAPGELAVRGPNVAAESWAKWFVAVKRAFDKLGSVFGSADSGLILITGWSIRETDTAWYGTLSLDDSQTTVTPALTGSSRFGQSVSTVDVSDGGDYDQTPEVLVSDPDHKGSGVIATAIMNGRAVDHVSLNKNGAGFLNAPTVSFEGPGTSPAVATSNLYPFAPGQRFLIDDGVVVDGKWAYEICEIESIDYGTGEWTITRGMLGTTPAAHTSKRFYLLVPGEFQKVLKQDAAPQCWKFLWPNMCVAIAEGQLLNGPVTTLNLFPSDDGQGARPGLRTMSGAGYISLGIDGVVALGQNTNRADAGQSWETIRTQIAKVRVAPSGAPFQLLLCWIAPNGTDVGLIGTITIQLGANQSYDIDTDPPRNRQMPYLYSANDPIWPPPRLTRCNSALDGSGTLLHTMTFGAREVYFEPNGDIVGVVLQPGGVEDLRVTLQT
jgi:hypothetical protein